VNDAPSAWEMEIQSGERFGFGQNWTAFLRMLDEDRITSAEGSLRDMLGRGSLEGLSFLDAGSGSGLLSLAARRFGATVHSFDYDPHSVACTAELKRRYFPDDARWTVEQGSVLDQAFLARLGTFDIVYSWGVLHHTGAMWQALENVGPLVAIGGQLFIAIYNDQGWASDLWKAVKRTYVSAPAFVKPAITLLSFARLWGPTMLRDICLGHPLRSWRTYADQPRARGMHPWRDVVDWVGGYPFEVARPNEVVDFYRHRGLEVQRTSTCGRGLGCNEFVFLRTKKIA